MEFLVWTRTFFVLCTAEYCKDLSCFELSAVIIPMIKELRIRSKFQVIFEQLTRVGGKDKLGVNHGCVLSSMNCQGVVLRSTGLRLDLVFFMINILLILLKLAPHLKPVTLPVLTAY